MTMKTKKVIDKKPIEELSVLLDEFNLTEISYQDGNFSVSVSRAAKEVSTTASQLVNSDSNKDNAESDFLNDPRAIKSPMVGTIYLQPEPGANAFVKKGFVFFARKLFLTLKFKLSTLSK